MPGDVTLDVFVPEAMWRIRDEATGKHLKGWRHNKTYAGLFLAAKRAYADLIKKAVVNPAVPHRHGANNPTGLTDMERLHVGWAISPDTH